MLSSLSVVESGVPLALAVNSLSCHFGWLQAERSECGNWGWNWWALKPMSSWKMDETDWTSDHDVQALSNWLSHQVIDTVITAQRDSVPERMWQRRRHFVTRTGSWSVCKHTATADSCTVIDYITFHHWYVFRRVLEYAKNLEQNSCTCTTLIQVRLTPVSVFKRVQSNVSLMQCTWL